MSMKAFNARMYREKAKCTDGPFSEHASAIHTTITVAHLKEVRRMLFWNRTGIPFLWLLYVIMLVMFVMGGPPQKAGEWAGLVIMIVMNLLFIQPLHDSMKNTVSSDTVVYAGIITYKYFTNAAGQEAPTSVSRGRNARFSGVFSLCTIALRQNI